MLAISFLGEKIKFGLENVFEYAKMFFFFTFHLSNTIGTRL